MGISRPVDNPTEEQDQPSPPQDRSNLTICWGCRHRLPVRVR